MSAWLSKASLFRPWVLILKKFDLAADLQKTVEEALFAVLESLSCRRSIVCCFRIPKMAPEESDPKLNVDTALKWLEMASYPCRWISQKLMWHVSHYRSKAHKTSFATMLHWKRSKHLRPFLAHKGVCLFRRLFAIFDEVTQNQSCAAPSSSFAVHISFAIFRPILCKATLKSWKDWRLPRTRRCRLFLVISKRREEMAWAVYLVRSEPQKPELRRLSISGRHVKQEYTFSRTVLPQKKSSR